MNNPINKTSRGQTLLRELLATILTESPLENHRPPWLFGMELDLYFPGSRLAFEFQGDQHFESGIFGDRGELARQQKRDAEKAKICRQGKIELRVVIASQMTFRGLIGRLAWKRKHWRFLQREGRLHDLQVMEVAGREVQKRALEYRRTLATFFDSATAYRGKWRDQALRRHNSPGMIP